MSPSRAVPVCRVLCVVSCAAGGNGSDANASTSSASGMPLVDYLSYRLAMSGFPHDHLHDVWFAATLDDADVCGGAAGNASESAHKECDAGTPRRTTSPLDDGVVLDDVTVSATTTVTDGVSGDVSGAASGGEASTSTSASAGVKPKKKKKSTAGSGDGKKAGSKRRVEAPPVPATPATVGYDPAAPGGSAGGAAMDKERVPKADAAAAPTTAPVVSSAVEAEAAGACSASVVSAVACRD